MAKIIAPKAKFKIVGIRPGEKVHETMCPSDDTHLTLEFDDHYVIQPSINFFDEDYDYQNNLIGEKGSYVKEGFEYSSGSNSIFLTSAEILDYE